MATDPRAVADRRLVEALEACPEVRAAADLAHTYCHLALGPPLWADLTLHA